MVKPNDFINAQYSDPIDRAILFELYLLRRAQAVSACEITESLTGRVADLSKKHEAAERTIRNHLSKLETGGEILKTIREATKKRGRAPEVYQLSDNFKAEIDNFLSIKDIPIGVRARMKLEHAPHSSVLSSKSSNKYDDGHMFAVWHYFTYLDTINLHNTIKLEGQDSITVNLVKDFQHPPYGCQGA